MLIADRQTAPNVKHGSFPVLKPALSPVFLKNHSDRSLPNRSEWEAWLVSCVAVCIFPSVFEETVLIAACQTASNAKHGSFPVLEPAVSLQFWRNHADRSLPNRSECEAWLVFYVETCIFPSVFEEIMLIAACQTAPHAKHSMFPVLKPALSKHFWRNHGDRSLPNSSECEACLVSCFETCMFPPLRMRSMARFLFWNLHFPLCVWRNHADRSLPNCSECKALLVSCFETCIVPSVFEETMLIAACQAAPNAKHS